LILQFDQDDGDDSFIAGFSTRNGEILWKTPRKIHSSWSTPLLVNSSGRPQLIASGTETTIAYDPRTGKEIWTGPGVEGNAVPTSVYGHGMVFLSAGYPTKKALAYRFRTHGAKLVWQYDKGTAYVPSPILYGDYLYIVTTRASSPASTPVPASLSTKASARLSPLRSAPRRSPSITNSSSLARTATRSSFKPVPNTRSWQPIPSANPSTPRSRSAAAVSFYAAAPTSIRFVIPKPLP